MLLTVKALPGKLCMFIQTAQQLIPFCLFILFLRINTHKTVKFHLGSCYRETISVCIDLYRGCLINCRCHSACGKTLPDQLIQSELFTRQRILDLRRNPLDIRRADRFMRILDLFAFLLLGMHISRIFAAIVFRNKLMAHCLSFFRYAGRIRTQIGDQTDRTTALDLHAFI